MSEPTNMEASANSAPEKDSKTDQNELFSLKVKPEYILDGRPPCLGALPSGDNNNNDDNRDNRSKNGKNNKKNNKKRPRNQRPSKSEKVCLSVVRGDACPFGEKCKYSHDLQEFLKTRPDDITTVEGGCPNFNETGYCLFGAMCRLGSCHLIKSTGENLRKVGVEAPPPVQNNMPKEVLLQLRKRNYPFKQIRVGRKSDSDIHEKEQEKGSTPPSEAKSDTNNNGIPLDDDDDDDDKSKIKSLESNNNGIDPDHNTAPSDAKDQPLKFFKNVHDPFRPSLADKDSNSTPMPSKTKKIIDFSNKVYVAPLTTVGNLPFRRILKRFGADITCGEMAVAGNLLDGKPSEWALLKRHPEEDIFGVQIASGYPDQCIRVCEVIENHLDVDFVDLNLGCPLDIICNKGAGSALMMRDKKLKGILQGVTSTLSCPVTIKMRTGWDMRHPIAHQLVSKVQSWGLEGIGAVMIHGRSRLQRYQKTADWDYVSRVARGQDDNMTKLNIIGNGDIFSYTDYEAKTAKEGISSAAMLGRGALIKPWLPTEIKERRHWDISATERLDILKSYVKFGLTHWGSDQQGVDNTRRFLLEWLSFLYRYVPVGLLEVLPQEMNHRPPAFLSGRNDLETLFLSPDSHDWVKISEMLLGPVPDGFRFEPKHKAKSYQ